MPTQRIQLCSLRLVYPPISNQEGEWLMHDPEVEADLRRSNIYMIVSRAEATFMNFKADAGDNSLSFEFTTGDELRANALIMLNELPGLEGIDAVADKDRVAAILGREIGAQVLLILTNVKAVYRGFGTPHQEAIRRLTLAQADHLLAGKELGTGSMRPKVEASADFVRAGGERAIIAELAHGLAALRGEAGTTLTKD